MADDPVLSRLRRHPYLITAHRHERQGVLVIMALVVGTAGVAVFVGALMLGTRGHYLVKGTATSGDATVDWTR